MRASIALLVALLLTPQIASANVTASSKTASGVEAEFFLARVEARAIQLAELHRESSSMNAECTADITIDPNGYADSPNLYAGMGNDPINQRDPTGRWIGAVAAVAAVAVAGVGIYDHLTTGCELLGEDNCFNQVVGRALGRADSGYETHVAPTSVGRGLSSTQEMLVDEGRRAGEEGAAALPRAGVSGADQMARGADLTSGDAYYLSNNEVRESGAEFGEGAVKNAERQLFGGAVGGLSKVRVSSGGGMAAKGAASLRRLGLGEVKLAGRSFSSGRKSLEKAGFRLERTTSTGRRVFSHPETGAEVYYDSGEALASGQKPHWHVRDSAGNRYDRSGRLVESDEGAGHIPSR